LSYKRKKMILQDTSIKLQPKKRPAEDQLILDDLDDSSSNRSNYSIEDSELAQIYERTKRAKIEATIDAKSQSVEKEMETPLSTTQKLQKTPEVGDSAVLPDDVCPPLEASRAEGEILAHNVQAGVADTPAIVAEFIRRLADAM
jgi:hypothetical protein